MIFHFQFTAFDLFDDLLRTCGSSVISFINILKLMCTQRPVFLSHGNRLLNACSHKSVKQRHQIILRLNRSGIKSLSQSFLDYRFVIDQSSTLDTQRKAIYLSVHFGQIPFCLLGPFLRRKVFRFLLRQRNHIGSIQNR